MSSPLYLSCERLFETFFRDSEHMRHTWRIWWNVKALFPSERKVETVNRIVIGFDVPVHIALWIQTRAQRAIRLWL